MRFDPKYVSQVLTENFEDAKALFLGPLMSIQYAHLVMLADRGIISPAVSHELRRGLDSISLSDVRQTPFDGTCEDLFSYVERRLTDACGADTAGRLHTARSRNDIDMTMYRLRQREYILGLIEATSELRAVLLDAARTHRTTLFAAHTHTQPAQPTTLAHYLLAVVQQLERDAVRLRAAFGTTNRCPLGACAITGTGFPIDRQLTSDLLGFDGPTGNTYGSIATVDYLLESASAAGVLVAGLGRFVQDLLLWCTVEVGYLRLSDGFVQSSTIMPQKRNPVGLEHARAIGSKALGQVSAIMMSVHNTPFGDIVDTEDDLQPLVASMFRDATRTVTLVGAALCEATFDVERMAARACEGGTTVTELADHLTREHSMPFRTAHAVAGGFLAARKADASRSAAEALNVASSEVTGAPLDLSDEQIEAILSPRHFVDVRQTYGGPAPSQSVEAEGESRASLDADRAWVARTRATVAAAADRLRIRSAAL